MTKLENYRKMSSHAHGLQIPNKIMYIQLENHYHLIVFP